MTKDQEIEMLKAQLAEAVTLIRDAKEGLRTGPSYGWEDRLASQLGDFLARHDQAEQQEACEPSAAEVIDSLTHPLCLISLRGDDRQKALANDLAKVIRQYQGADQEALATQPAVPEQYEYWSNALGCWRPAQESVEFLTSRGFKVRAVRGAEHE